LTPPKIGSIKIFSLLPFAGVGSLDIGGAFLCTGSVISTTHVLTAGHCLDTNDDGDIDFSASEIVFNLNNNGDLSSQISASALALHPEFLGFDNTVNHDLAIITLSQPVPAGVPVYDLHTSPLLPGDEITLVGYGQTGDGLTGLALGTASLTVKRTGQNLVDDPGLFSEFLDDFDQAFIFDFDSPFSDALPPSAGSIPLDGATSLDNINVLLGLPATTSLGNAIETTVGPGDSGGPSFFCG
jgi:hypothetical protein